MSFQLICIKISSMGKVMNMIMLTVCFGVLLIGAIPVFAYNASSTNYALDEYFFGTGGELSSSSANYQSKMAAGETTVGNSKSTNYQFNGGFNTTDTPLLEFAVNGGIYDLGVLNPTATSTVTPTFTVRNYLSSGYVVIMNGTPPITSDGTHTLTPMSTASNSQIGAEQFGVNLVNNTTPATGTNPVQVPDSSFSFGVAAGAYSTQNQFKFVSGDTIAMSGSSSGQTNYTMSVIANITKNTPAGQYGGNINLEVIPTF